MTGAIPAELGSLAGTAVKNLTNLTSLGSLTNLQWLHLWGNQLIGEIPYSLGSLANLHYAVPRATTS